MLTQQVQAAIDTRRRAGRGQQRAIIDVEHTGIQAYRREALVELARPRPVSGGLASVQQACLG